MSSLSLSVFPAIVRMPASDETGIFNEKEESVTLVCSGQLGIAQANALASFINASRGPLRTQDQELTAQ